MVPPPPQITIAGRAERERLASIASIATPSCSKTHSNNAGNGNVVDNHQGSEQVEFKVPKIQRDRKPEYTQPSIHQDDEEEEGAISDLPSPPKVDPHSTHPSPSKAQILTTNGNEERVKDGNWDMDMDSNMDRDNNKDRDSNKDRDRDRQGPSRLSMEAYPTPTIPSRKRSRSPRSPSRYERNGFSSGRDDLESNRSKHRDSDTRGRERSRDFRGKDGLLPGEAPPPRGRSSSGWSGSPSPKNTERWSSSNPWRTAADRDLCYNHPQDKAYASRGSATNHINPNPYRPASPPSPPPPPQSSSSSSRKGPRSAYYPRSPSPFRAHDSTPSKSKMYSQASSRHGWRDESRERGPRSPTLAYKNSSRGPVTSGPLSPFSDRDRSFCGWSPPPPLSRRTEADGVNNRSNRSNYDQRPPSRMGRDPNDVAPPFLSRPDTYRESRPEPRIRSRSRSPPPGLLKRKPNAGVIDTATWDRDREDNKPIAANLSATDAVPPINDSVGSGPGSRGSSLVSPHIAFKSSDDGGGDAKIAALWASGDGAVLSRPGSTNPFSSSQPERKPAYEPEANRISKIAAACEALDDPSCASVRLSCVPRDQGGMTGPQRRKLRPPPIPLNERKFYGCSSLDDYEITVKLGQGTFGEVKKGRHIVSGMQVALKKVTIHEEKDGMPITALREIKLLKKLSHPSIVPVVDMAYRPSGERGKLGDVYMVEPYMDHDLNGMLENPNIRLEHSQIKLYMKQLLQGTLYLHKNRILHRDMKAANLLINNQGQLQVADFGLARPYRDPGQGWKAKGWQGGLNKYTNMVVTRWYRPPELLAGEKKYGPPIDMWGIGCILAEMVTGKPIFKGNSEINQLELIARLCGSPNESNFPCWNSLPGVKDADPNGRPDPNPHLPGRHDFGNYERNVKQYFRTVVDVGPECADLIDKLLILDPAKRLTAAEALDHDWFWSKPYPADPSSLPKYDPSKEIDRAKREWKSHPNASMVPPVGMGGTGRPGQKPNIPTLGQPSLGIPVAGNHAHQHQHQHHHNHHHQQQPQHHAGMGMGIAPGMPANMSIGGTATGVPPPPPPMLGMSSLPPPSSNYPSLPPSQSFNPAVAAGEPYAASGPLPPGPPLVLPSNAGGFQGSATGVLPHPSASGYPNPYSNPLQPSSSQFQRYPPPPLASSTHLTSNHHPHHHHNQNPPHHHHHHRSNHRDQQQNYRPHQQRTHPYSQQQQRNPRFPTSSNSQQLPPKPPNPNPYS